MVQKSLSLKMEVKALGFSKLKFCFGMCTSKFSACLYGWNVVSEKATL